MVDLEELKTKMIEDYRRLWGNKHRFELNDDEVDVNDCISKMEYIFETLMFITGESREVVGATLASHINYVIEFEPDGDPQYWDLNKFDYVEVVEDILYSPLKDFCYNNNTTESQLKREGFIICPYDNGTMYVIIPKGTVMRFNGADANGWPTFTLRMKFDDYELDFAGDIIKLKLI